MTVQEILDKLKGMPPTMEVLVETTDDLMVPYLGIKDIEETTYDGKSVLEITVKDI